MADNLNLNGRKFLMTSRSDNGSFAGPPRQSAQDSPLSSPEKLITFAQGYFASDFPNPERIDCPMTGTLSDLVRSGKAPDNHLRSHMFGCSECFNQYRNALAIHRAEMQAAAGLAQDSWWKKLFATNLLRPIPIFASALSLILLVFVGAYIRREYRTAHQQIVLKRDSAPPIESSANPSTNNPPSITIEPSPLPARPFEPSTSPQENNKRKTPVWRPRQRSSTDENLIVMSIDLRDYAMTRGGTVSRDYNTINRGRAVSRDYPMIRDGSVSGNQITLSPARTRMLMTLPEDGGKGFYTVSIVDASGETLETRNAFSNDGKNLRAMLNMQRLQPQKYELHISRAGKPPINIPIVIKSPLKLDAEKTVHPKAGDVVRPRQKP